MKTATEWGQFFDEFAPTYERDAFGGAGLAIVSTRELDAIRSALAAREPGAVLDAGAGTGRITRLLRGMGWDVTAADNSAEMLAGLRRELPDLRAVHARLGEPLPFADSTFDAVVSIRVLKYVAALDVALTEIARVLRPGGVAVLEITNARSVARAGYRRAPVHALTIRGMEAAMQHAGLAPVARAAGTRLPHLAWDRARSMRGARAVASVDGAVGRLLGGDTRAIGARSVILVGQRR
jgi:ubiquinone/menaquinone biosynthesis C-methylase UbiE